MKRVVNNKKMEPKTKGSKEMAEGKESIADIGQNEAGAVNMKMVVADEKDCAGRTRSYYDNAMVQLLETQAGLSKNYGVSIAATNEQIIAINKQLITTIGKQDEQITGVNMTDVMEKQIAGSPYEDLAKTIATAVVAAMNATAEDAKKK